MKSATAAMTDDVRSVGVRRSAPGAVLGDERQRRRCGRRRVVRSPEGVNGALREADSSTFRFRLRLLFLMG